MTALRKARSSGPHKLLALDGGGIRGMLAVEILADIESRLRRKLKANKSFVLSDYFDYISGTSTGAIIAAALSLGWPVSRLRKFYVERGADMFDKAGIFKRFKYKFDDDLLRELLQKEFGKSTNLGSTKLKTLLMMVLRNATTDSPWPVSNNPFAFFNNKQRADCNLELPLWQLVRASTAAPTYFPPEQVSIGKNDFVFVDGGVTMYNNPAFQMFVMATAEAYKLGWTSGEDQMLIVSIGTGMAADANADLEPNEMNLLYNAGHIPSALMAGAQIEQDTLCRIFGKCKSGAPLDMELGDLIDNGAGPLEKKLFTYVRYNADLTKAGLTALGLKDIEPTKVQKLDSTAEIPNLMRIGKAVARKSVRNAHFAGFV